MKSRWANPPGISRHSLYKTRAVERGETGGKKKKRLLSEMEEIVGNL